MKIKDTKAIKMIPIFVFLVVITMFTNATKSTSKTSYYDKQYDAALRMKVLSESIKDYKKELDIPIYKYDTFGTGLLGDEYNDITTSLGNLEAKRTSANPDMAALVVKMFHEVNLKPGDRVAVGFSGSFPALNLAVLSAAESMDLDLIIISSMGSSTYGANQKNLTFPKMLALLHSDRLTKYNSVLVTPGGDDDIASDIDDEIKERIFDEYKELGLRLVIEPNFEKNIELKVEEYFKDGKIDCYIAVGGNISFLGLEEGDLNQQGIIRRSNIRQNNFDVSDGLLKYFTSKNIPTIHLLNIKKITTEYGMPYDPAIQTNIGEGNIYMTQYYNKFLIVFSLIITMGALFCISKGRKQNV